jgi:hypothetical protein
MATRVKVICTAVGKTGNGQNHIAFAPVPAGSPENEQVFLSTPGGSMSLITVTDTTMSRFKPGTQYFMDIYPADPALNVDALADSNPAGVAPSEARTVDNRPAPPNPAAVEVNRMNPTDNPNEPRNLTNEVKNP